MTTSMNFERMRRIRSTISAAMLFVLLLSVIVVGPSAAFATGDTSESDVESELIDIGEKVANKIYNSIRGLILTGCGVMVAVAGVKCLGGTKGVQSAMTILTGCAISACLVIFAPLLIREFSRWFNDTGTENPLSDYNTLEISGD